MSNALPRLFLLCPLVITALAVRGAFAAESVPEDVRRTYQSKRYRIERVVADATSDQFVYQSLNAWKDAPKADGGNYEYETMGKEHHWTSLSSSRPVTLRIADLRGKMRRAELRPHTPRASVKILPDGRAEVAVTPSAKEADYYYLRLNDGASDPHPLFIFVDPPEENVPDRGGRKVRYFGPGIHDIGPHYKVGDGETVYIASGAVVRGTIDAQGDNIRIAGRGILSGELMQLSWMKYKRVPGDKRDSAPKPKGWEGPSGWTPMIWVKKGRAPLIEGITVIDHPHWGIRTKEAENSVIRNTKSLAWNYSSDGIGPGTGTLVENCFLKVNDDCFTLYHSNITLRNVVIWKQLNASVFMLGYGYNGKRENIRAENIQVLRDETKYQVRARGILTMASSKGNSFENFVVDGLKVYGDTLNLLAIDNYDAGSPWSAKVEDVKLGPVNIVMKNVEVTGTEEGFWAGVFDSRQGQPMRSRLRTEETGSIRVQFENVRINGRLIRSAKDFPNGLETKGNVKLEFGD